jgi:hypothetical protein
MLQLGCALFHNEYPRKYHHRRDGYLEIELFV